MPPSDEINNPNSRIGVIGSPSDSFEAVVDILGISSEDKILGELVFFQVIEGDNQVVSIGQLTEIRTENRWHEEPSFKAVIKRHGSLPHLSGVADNRIATLNIQSSFKYEGEQIVPHKLSNSPSTGAVVGKVNNEILDELLAQIIEGQDTENLGRAYDTQVNIPFWFKHFGAGDGGAGDAYHIGVFGKTGSGKTTTAAQIIRGYASNSDRMSILILDPQEQFFHDQEVLPRGVSFRQEVQDRGMNYGAYRIPEHVHLPNDPELFSQLLLSSDTIRKVFRLPTDDKRELMQEQIFDYLLGRMSNPGFRLANQNGRELLEAILNRFIDPSNRAERDAGFTRYVTNVYATPASQNRLLNRMTQAREQLQNGVLPELADFEQVLNLFRRSNEHVMTLDEMVDRLINHPGNLFIVNLSPRGAARLGNENVQALLIKLITDKIVEQGEILYSEGRKANCLVVMDEAHRYTNSSATDPKAKQLNSQIVDAVRTTRKYGVGFMFISQTIESIHNEIIQQMRIFSFGYGLTMGSEMNKIKQIINDEGAAKFYRSFIDPSSNGKFPFMFFGPISPLSFTGTPLFIEMA